MTTAPSTRPPTAPGMPGAPGASRPGSAQAGASIDPIKILKKYKWILAGAAACGGILGFCSYWALNRVAPVYRSTVMFECTAPVTSAGAPPGGERYVEAELERFILNQVQILQSDFMLTNVLKDPRLMTEASDWVKPYISRGAMDEPEGLKALRDSVRAVPLPNTSYVRLTAEHSKAADATGLVKLLKEAYLNHRQTESRLALSLRRDVLRKSIEGLDREITRLQGQRDRIIDENGIDSGNVNSSGAAKEQQLANSTLQALDAQLESLNVQRQNYESELAAPGGITYSADLIAAADQQPIVQEIRRTINAIESSMTALTLRGISREHRDYKTMQAQLDAQKQKLAEQQESSRRQMFESQLDSIRKAIASIEAQKADLLSKREEYSRRLADLAKVYAEIADLEGKIGSALKTRGDRDAQLRNLEELFNADEAGRVEVAQAERLPDGPAFPKLLVFLPLGIMLGLGVSGGIVFLREVFDQRVKGPSDIAMMPRTRLLGMIPDASEDPSAPPVIETAFRDAPKGAVAESHRQLRATLLKRMQQAGHRSLAVVSTAPGSGATSFVTNFGLACAASDLRVLLIDANFRRPRLHTIYAQEASPGLADILAGDSSLDACAQPTGTTGLDVLCVGAADQRIPERLANEGFARLVAEASAKYDLVLIDCAPALVAGDAVALANRCDASVLIVRALSEKRGLVARVKNELSEARGELIGIVVNAVKSAAGGYMRSNIRTAHEYHSSAA